jgi:hypothetical protein
MKKQTARTLMIVAGVLILLVVLGLGAAVWLFTRTVNVGKADAASVGRRFEEVREQFAGITPVLEVTGRRASLTRQPPEHGTGTRLTTMRILAWDADDDGYAQIDLPFWLLRLKSGPIEIGTNGPLRDTDLQLTVDDLERYGPTLLLDHEDRNSRVLVWTE